MKEVDSDHEHNIGVTPTSITPFNSFGHMNSISTNHNDSTGNTENNKNKFRLGVKRVTIHEPSITCTVQNDCHTTTSIREAENYKMQAEEYMCLLNGEVNNNNNNNNNVVNKISVHSDRNISGLIADKSAMTITETNAPMRYGGGIVRISDLRARGETFLESGLNLQSMSKRPRQECKFIDNNRETHFNPVYATGQEQTLRENNQYTLNNVNSKSTSHVIESARHELSKQEENWPVEYKSARTILQDSTTIDYESQCPPYKKTKTRKRSSGKKEAKKRNKRQGLVLSDSFTGGDSFTFSDINDASNYRWYTVKGRRRLVVNGKTYRGRAAHSLWRTLKKKATQANRQSSTTLAPSTRKQGANAQLNKPSKIVKALSLYSPNATISSTKEDVQPPHTLSRKTSMQVRRQEKENSRTPSTLLQVKIPLRPSALELLRMPALPLRSTTLGELEEQKQRNKIHQFTQIGAIKDEFDVHNTENITGVTDKRDDEEKRAAATHEVISVVDTDDEVESTKSTIDDAHDRSSRNVETQTLDAHQAELESTNSFSSTWDDDSSSCCSNFNDNERKCNENDNISDGDDWGSSNDSDDVDVSIDTSNQKSTTRNKSQNNSIGNENDKYCRDNIGILGVQDVVEYDGWVYPAEVFAAIEEAKLAEVNNCTETRNKNTLIESGSQYSDTLILESSLANVKQNAAEQTCAGLEIVGCQKANRLAHLDNKREMSRAVFQPAPTCTMPILVNEDLYTNHDVFDGLDSRELAGMFETGDEVGGVRYSAL